MGIHLPTFIYNKTVIDSCIVVYIHLMIQLENCWYCSVINKRLAIIIDNTTLRSVVNYLVPISVIAVSTALVIIVDLL